MSEFVCAGPVSLSLIFQREQQWGRQWNSFQLHFSSYRLILPCISINQAIKRETCFRAPVLIFHPAFELINNSKL